MSRPTRPLAAALSATFLVLAIGACDAEDETANEPETRVADPEDGPQRHHAEMMAKLDVDEDGAISAEEAEAHPWLGKKFEYIDGDGDGRITAEELNEVHAEKGRHHGKDGHGKKGHHKRMWAELDADGDGAISSEEAEGKPIAEKFDSLDADGDGAITKEEMKSAHRKLRVEKMDAWIAEQDADGDGALSPDEVSAFPRLHENFSAVDADGSGTVDGAEISAWKASSRGKKGHHGPGDRHRE